ncbi:phospholipase [Cryobacterium suzukii]|uniref:Phospholipase n=1 Tax=Cryobacterium suzukii TaxID=1259198 RepID=A0A4R9AEG3_9MICO|nr:phospholipase [Cryobacterium suzukii]TFD58915.1 phospholipase [Cryobacterium suzukii]
MRPKPTETPHAHVALPGTQIHRKPRKPRTSRHEIAAATGTVLVIAGLVASSGFVAQSADATQDSIAATTVLADSRGLQSDQLDVYVQRGETITRGSASAALSAAHVVIAASQSKVDAATLTSVVSSLASYAILPIERVESLTAEAKAETASVAAATAEVDRVAAEAAAAAAAEAAAIAAAQAAAEAARMQSLAGGNSVDGARATARSMAASQYGWGEDQFSCLDRLWQKESRWNYAAVNSSSGATGIPQALPGSKMASAGNDWATNATTQISWGLGYIKASSYGTPCAAWSHSQSVGWY